MRVTCLIPAAGKGTRMRPLTHTLPKAMLPVAGKPAIFHIIDAVRKTGIQDFVIITGYLRELMEQEIKDAYPDLNISFVLQQEQKGLGHAIFLAEKDIIQQNALLIIYGDTLFEADLNTMIQSTHPVIGVSEVEDARRFGVVELDGSGEYIINFVEKPEVPPTNLAIPGVNFFPQAADVFKAMKLVIERDIKTKNEYQITDAYDIMLKEMKIKMRYQKLNAWYDCGTLEDILLTNQKMLDHRKSTQDKKDLIKNLNVKIIEPVYLGKDCKLENSVIGPHVSIANSCIIKNSTISDSIIDLQSNIEDSILENSIVGRKVHIQNIKGKCIAGDDSIIQNQNA